MKAVGKKMWKKSGIRLLVFVLSALLLAGCGQQNVSEPNSDVPSRSSSSDKAASEAADGEEASSFGADWKVQFAEIGLGAGGEYVEFTRTEGVSYAITAAMNQQEEYKLPYLTDEKLWNVDAKQYFDTLPISMAVGLQPVCLASDGSGILYLLAKDFSETPALHFLYIIGTDGEVQQLDITESCETVFGSEEFVNTMAVDDAGRIYLGAFLGKDRLLMLEPDDSKTSVVNLQEITVNGTQDMNDIIDIHDMAAVDGRVYCVGMVQGTDKLFVVNEDSRRLEEVTELPESQGTLMLCQGAAGSLLYGYYGGIYEYRVESKEGQDIYSWTNAGLTGRDVSDMLADEQGNICVIPKEQASKDSMELILLQNPAATGTTAQNKNAGGESSENVTASQVTEFTGQSAAEQPAREEIIIAGNPADEELTKVVRKFNLKNDKYNVVIREYDYDLLLTSIITGNGPDLFSVSSIGAAVCAGKGVAEDLTPYLENSEVLAADMLQKNVLEAATADGKLLSIPPSFSLTTLWGKGNELGSESGWTTDEFMDYVNQNQGKTVVEGVLVGDSRVNIVYMMWLARQEQWIDWEQRKALFDSREFRELLQFAVNYKSEQDVDYNEPNRDSTETRWQDGKILLYARPISSMYRYRWCKQFLGEGAVPIGYPTEDGSPCHLLSLKGDYGINSMSEHKDGAWAFIEFLVASQTAEDAYQNAIPVLKSEIEVMLEQSKAPMRDMEAATEEDIAAFRALMDNAISSDDSSSEVSSILSEELETCVFQGRSVDETVRIIQNRVQLYLDEM